MHGGHVHAQFINGQLGSVGTAFPTLEWESVDSCSLRTLR